MCRHVQKQWEIQSATNSNGHKTSATTNEYTTQCNGDDSVDDFNNDPRARNLQPKSIKQNNKNTQSKLT